ncbi:MAG: hypothetical protein ACR2J3_05665 [Aridibacter sp.]
MNSLNNLKDSKNKHIYGFSSYGVKIGLIASSRKILNEMKEAVNYIPLNPSEIKFEEAEFCFSIDFSNGQYLLLKGQKELSLSDGKFHTFKYLQNEIRITVAEFAVSKVFIHAGAVSIDNIGIIFPAKSFKGKSTLTAELVKAGAVYYSDDYTILDENAYLHPFPRRLSMRGITGEYSQVDVPVEDFGGVIGVEPVEIKLIVLTEFEEGYQWSPEIITPGNAVLELLPHTIPIRFNPKFTLEVLHKLVNRAIITKSKRGDSKEFIPLLLKYLEIIDF